MENETKNKLVVLQGKVFSVDLVSYLGSTNYGWCLSKLPEGIWLVGYEDTCTGRGYSTTLQQFYFCAVKEPEDEPCVIGFKLACLSNLEEVSQEYSVEVTVVPSNSEKFAQVSENGGMLPNIDIDPQGLHVAYGFPRMKYGYFCELQQPCTDYGYSAGTPNGNVKYGYPCGAQDANMKYGYPCGAQDANMKYGYFCGAQDASMKYGYPCGAQDANMKYGYFCGAQDANMKYGYPCGAQDANMKYGYFCGAQDANMKYGYPCGAQDANMKYGYFCRDISKEARPYGVPYWN